MNRKQKPGPQPGKFDPDGFSPDLDGVAEHLGISLRALHNARKRFASDRPKHRHGGPYPKRAYKNWADRHGVTGRRTDAEMVDERDVKLAHAQLRFKREQFEFEKVKSEMLPLAQYQFALQEFCTSLLATLNAFTGRVNPLLDGLDFHDRQIKMEEEIEIVKRAIYAADFLPKSDPNVE